MRRFDRWLARYVPLVFAVVFAVAALLEAVGVSTGGELKALAYISVAVFWLHLWDS